MPSLLQDDKAGKAFEWTDECRAAFEELKRYLRSLPLLSKPKEDEQLLPYLAILPNAVSSILVREDAGIQKPIYYMSKLLRDAET